jgi:hypothetical protein
MSRIVEININNRWQPASVQSIRKGDVFRVTEKGKKKMYRATSDAQQNPETKVWKVAAI